jgi:shikimate kinase
MTGKPVVVLVGPPGSGKTTVGTLLAERLGVPFRDTDADVEAVTGMLIAELFVEKGEPYFRELESEAVRAALETCDGVLSLGGGAVTREETRAALARHRVAYLQVEIAEAVKRVGMNVARPLLLGNVRGQLGKLLEQRVPLYESIATITVATSGRPIADIAEDIVRELPC